jgi:hypothetical protein
MKAGVEELLSEGFLGQMEKRLRNKKKRLEKIAHTEKRVKSKEIQLNDEQRDMLAGKESLL